VSETTIKTSTATLVGLMAGLIALGVWAQAQKAFPGPPVDQRTMRTQVRVDELYESGDYGRALLIYQKELSPIGDKYAQYMVGYMHLAGQGVPAADRPAALAWYRLAAERGDPSIVQARDQLYQAMSSDEVEMSSEIFVNIWQEYGDNSLLLELVREDMDLLRKQTGTRVSGGDRPTTVINVRSGQAGTAVYYDRVESRIDVRLDYLETSVEITDVAIAKSAADIRSVGEELRKEFAALQSP